MCSIALQYIILNDNNINITSIIRITSNSAYALNNAKNNDYDYVTSYRTSEYPEAYTVIPYCSYSCVTNMSTSSMPASLYANHTAYNIMFLVGLWSKM